MRGGAVGPNGSLVEDLVLQRRANLFNQYTRKWTGEIGFMKFAPSNLRSLQQYLHSKLGVPAAAQNVVSNNASAEKFEIEK